MAKDAFDKIMAGIDSAAALAEGRGDAGAYRIHVPKKIDVKAIRLSLNFSQAEFASRFAISLHTLRKWEQQGREPEGPARAYLQVIQRNPAAVLAALNDAG